MTDQDQARQIAAGILHYLGSHHQDHLLSAVIRALQSSAGSKQAATVESAAPLSATEKTEINQLLARRYSITTPPVYQVIPELLGGFRIRLGDQILDLSITGRLDQLHAQT